MQAGHGKCHFSTGFWAELQDLGWSYFLLSSFWGASLSPQSPRWAQAPRMAAMMMGDPSSLLVGEAYKRPAAAFCRPHFTCGASESLWSRSSTGHLISLVLVSEKLTRCFAYSRIKGNLSCSSECALPCLALDSSFFLPHLRLWVPSTCLSQHLKLNEKRTLALPPWSLQGRPAL